MKAEVVPLTLAEARRDAGLLEDILWNLYAEPAKRTFAKDAEHIIAALAPSAGRAPEHGDHPRDSYLYDGCPGCEPLRASSGEAAPVDGLRAAAANVADRRTLMDGGFWVSRKEMRALDIALGREDIGIAREEANDGR